MPFILGQAPPGYDLERVDLGHFLVSLDGDIRPVRGACLFCGDTCMVEITGLAGAIAGRVVGREGPLLIIDALPPDMHVFGCISCNVAVYQPADAPT